MGLPARVNKTRRVVQILQARLLGCGGPVGYHTKDSFCGRALSSFSPDLFPLLSLVFTDARFGRATGRPQRRAAGGPGRCVRREHVFEFLRLPRHRGPTLKSIAKPSSHLADESAARSPSAKRRAITATKFYSPKQRSIFNWCCLYVLRGRPIIVEWERDARHSAGLSRSVTHRYVTERYTFQSDSQPQPNLRRCHVKIESHLSLRFPNNVHSCVITQNHGGPLAVAALVPHRTGRGSEYRGGDSRIMRNCHLRHLSFHTKWYEMKNVEREH
ncbi:hypothetical protein EVAR_13073_1 [Eumeta japonica]|uniref:Uncharacterized protein n=1 Tax=Eumeta variegata TaxID=151549 RepID=A0A4C2A4M1_EUMVA|nr:hypothetical protein EVAR_13073_1 [Eumeta japonica]